jgi:hypothetical protein
LKLKYKDTDNYTLNLDELPYGGSCTYNVEAKCGYPNINVNNTNIDMVVTFKKKELSNDVYEPSNGEVYEPDETANPKAKNGKIEYKFP